MKPKITCSGFSIIVDKNRVRYLCDIHDNVDDCPEYKNFMDNKTCSNRLN